VNTSPGISGSEVGRRGVAGGDGRKKQWLAGVGEDETDSSAPVGRETRGEAASSEGTNQKGNRIPVKTRPTRRLGGPAGAVSAYGGSEASGLAGPKDEWAARSAGPKVSKKNF
jgi:hypothetical protein